jgi:hypothetical protein
MAVTDELCRMEYWRCEAELSFGLASGLHGRYLMFWSSLLFRILMESWR